MSKKSYREVALEVLDIEERSIRALKDRLGDQFDAACELLLACRGRAVVCGIGKSGAVGRKLAGSLASTGTAAFFMHPAEAIHGDLGMVTADDVVILLSNSGETEEVVNILPAIRRRGARIIALCGAARSRLGKEADAFLDAGVEREACPLGLAPTASCIAAMAIGDALAMALMAARGFTVDDYALSHPGGSLGRRTLWRVRDVMHCGDDNPCIATDASVMDAVLCMSRAAVRGAVSVVNADGTLAGLFTDGDFRVAMQRSTDRNELMSSPIATVMHANPTAAYPDMLAASAARLMQEREFDNLPVVDENNLAVGMVDIQDLLKAGLV